MDSSTHRTALITLTVCLLSPGCVDYGPEDYSASHGVVTITPLADSIPADGVSAVDLVVQIPDDTDLNRRSVQLGTTLGAFDERGSQSLDVVVDSHGVATLSLHSGTLTGTARVTATVASYSSSTMVMMARAWPESLSVDAGGFTLAATYSEALTVRAQLIRHLGTTTPETFVSFFASDSTGSSIGAFRSTTRSNAEGEATALFSLGPTMYRGPVRIAARIVTPSGVVSGTAQIAAIDP